MNRLFRYKHENVKLYENPTVISLLKNTGGSYPLIGLESPNRNPRVQKTNPLCLNPESCLYHFINKSFFTFSNLPASIL